MAPADPKQTAVEPESFWDGCSSCVLVALGGFSLLLGLAGGFAADSVAVALTSLGFLVGGVALLALARWAAVRSRRQRAR